MNYLDFLDAAATSQQALPALNERYDLIYINAAIDMLLKPLRDANGNVPPVDWKTASEAELNIRIAVNSLAEVRDRRLERLERAIR